MLVTIFCYTCICILLFLMFSCLTCLPLYAVCLTMITISTNCFLRLSICLFEMLMMYWIFAGTIHNCVRSLTGGFYYAWHSHWQRSFLSLFGESATEYYTEKSNFSKTRIPGIIYQWNNCISINRSGSWVTYLDVEQEKGVSYLPVSK